MSQLIFKGIGTGLILSVMLGPAFFLLIETSIKKGIRAAVSFDAGVLTSDIIYIFIAYIFIQQVEAISHGDNNAFFRAGGGLLLMVYGYFTLRKKSSDLKKNKDKSVNIDSNDYWVLYIKGFLLNLINPLIVFYWFSVMAFGHSGTTNVVSRFEMFIFIVSVLTTFGIIDLLKIIGAKKLRPFLTSKLLNSLNRITGSILMAFGLFLVISSIVIWAR